MEVQKPGRYDDQQPFHRIASTHTNIYILEEGDRSFSLQIRIGHDE